MLGWSFLCRYGVRMGTWSGPRMEKKARFSSWVCLKNSELMARADDVYLPTDVERVETRGLALHQLSVP